MSILTGRAVWGLPSLFAALSGPCLTNYSHIALDVSVNSHNTAHVAVILAKH